MAQRILSFEAIENVRDFGDYGGAGGSRVAGGRLLRSGHHARATDADLERLAGLGVSTIVDLRRGAERREQPCRRYPGFAGQVIEGGDDGYGEAPHITFLKNTDLTPESVRAFMLQTYRDMPFDDRHLELFRQYFAALATGEGAVLIHCAAGKDRTGLLAALTHHLLGVSDEDLLEDYLLTNTAVRLAERAPEIAGRIRAAYGKQASEAAVIAFLGVEPGFLEAAFASIRDAYGSVDAYLEQALGVDHARREAVAATLQGERA